MKYLSILVGLGMCWLAVGDDTITLSKPEPREDPDNAQMEMKRDWNRNLHSWGKRAWQNLQGGWGKRDLSSVSSFPLYYQFADKRAWQNLQGGWGKSLTPEDELALEQLAALVEREDRPPTSTFDENTFNGANNGDEEKRAWRALNGGWGKRADNWANFRGSWGKRDPAWNNLKGIWGKRSFPDRVAQ